MLAALADGRALPAGELATAAGVSAQAASAHLAKLLDGGLLAMEREGRHRYYRLAGPEVGALLEGLASFAGAAPRGVVVHSREGRELRFARTCYDHLAGELGVAVAGVLEEHEVLAQAEGKRLDITPVGRVWLASTLDIDVAKLTRIIHRTARNRPRPPNTWARDFIAKNFIKQPIRIVVNDINGLALIAHFS